MDGGLHASRAAADAPPDAALGSLGYRVLRLRAVLVEREPKVALALVRKALAR